MSEPWFRSAVVYQIYPRSFADSNGDGVGDLGGVIEQLDHLALLGVDVVWLSPIYVSPQDDNGYDIADYYDIDPTFGTLQQFDELLAAAHARDIKIVMDLVVNHTSDEHPWFVESRSSLDNPKRDWYWWRGPRDGAEPNNWGSFFSGPAWQLDETTGEYYLHLFSKKQPDLNWENPDVRDAVYEMMRWWLDRGVDGFRMDVINFISKVTDLPDGRVHEGHRYGSIAPFVFNGPRIHEFLQEMHREVFAGREGAFLTVGEMPGVSVEQARLYTDPDRAEVDMVFQFEHMGVDQGSTKWDVLPLDLPRLKAVLGKWQDGLAEVGWNSLYWNNHDQPRVVSRFGNDGQFREASAKALGTVLHLLRGTPYVYQGEELGMTNVPFESIAEYRDLEAVNHYAEAVGHGADPDDVLAGLAAMSRDHARVPMQWDDSPYAGFSTVEPWIRVNPNFVEINAAAQRDDAESVFSHYRRLIEFRHSEPAVASGSFELLAPDHPALFAYIRRLGATELLVVANWSGAPLDLADLVDADAWSGAETVIRSAPRAVEQPAVEQPVGERHVGEQPGWELAPWEARVLRKTTR